MARSFGRQLVEEAAQLCSAKVRRTDTLTAGAGSSAAANAAAGSGAGGSAAASATEEISTSSGSGPGRVRWHSTQIVDVCGGAGGR